MSENRGLYNKYRVERLWSPGSTKKHDDCDYFVLDLSHDKHAHPAIAAYVQSLREQGEYGMLADDLYEKYLRDD